MMLMLLALLAGIVGLAEPRTNRTSITVVFDRGLTMPPTRAADLPVGDYLGVNVPANAVRSVPWRTDLGQARREHPDALFVTDQPIDALRARLAAIENVGIDHVGVDETGVLVRLRGQGQRAVRIGQVHADVRVDGSAEVVLDVAPTTDRLVVELAPADAITADDRFFLVRASAEPRVVVDGSVDPAVGRFAAVWSTERGGDGVRVLLTTDEAASGPAVVFARGPFVPVAGALSVVPGPITNDVRWARWLDQATAAPMPEGFRAVVSLGGVPVVGESAGRVWIGLDPASVSARPDWVVLLANAVTHVGGAPVWTSEPITVFPPGELVTTADPSYAPSPGIYEVDGVPTAYNAAVAEPRGAPGPLVLPTETWAGVSYRRSCFAVAAVLWLSGLAGWWRLGRP